MTCLRRFAASACTGAFALALLVVLLVPSLAAAQAANGTLLGTVMDESGAGVPGVTVTATEVQTNIPRTAVSNSTGYYSTGCFTGRASSSSAIISETVFLIIHIIGMTGTVIIFYMRIIV